MKAIDQEAVTRPSAVERVQGALIAAAVGDAMGWPQEPRSRRISPRTGRGRQDNRSEFTAWTRRAGGRFFSHEELIRPGEYSDDTQLLLCTARSLVLASDWWRHLTRRELPTWTLYERGAGGAVKRAADAWLAGHEPWSRSGGMRDRYFAAGGNGAAMRVLPHCLANFRLSDDFGTLARDIVANAVCTHGHPRALIGALAYGFACFTALRETATLHYGYLIEKLLAFIENWSSLPDFSKIWPDWLSSVKPTGGKAYNLLWRETADEMRVLIEHSLSGIQEGALSVDEEVLTGLGCFDKQIGGAGTVTAAGAVFLASRYAADPLNGILAAAFLAEADSDTLASMTGALLGAIHGIEWIAGPAGRVQDADYLRQIGNRLAEGGAGTGQMGNEIVPTTKREITRFTDSLKEIRVGEALQLPDGRQARLSEPQLELSKFGSSSAVSWKLDVADGQSIYVKKLSRDGRRSRSDVRDLFAPPSVAETPRNTAVVEAVKAGVKLPVRDIAKSRVFYEQGLGLKVARESKSLVNLSEAIALVRQPEAHQGECAAEVALPSHSILYIEVRRIQPAYENLRNLGAKSLTEICQRQSQRFFKCVDPDGNIVEVFELSKGEGGKSGLAESGASF